MSIDNFKLSDEFKTEVLAPTIGIDYVNMSAMSALELTLCPHNKHYANSPFYYDGQEYFLHFTSVENLLRIIQSNTLRLYNFLNEDDTENYNFAGEILEIQNISKAKHNTFILSMFKEQDEYNLNIWDLYAEEKKGVVVKLSFSNDLEEWERFHLSSVFYNKHKQFDAYQELLKEFQERYKMPWLNVDFSRFAGLYKKNRYSSESEARLLYYHGKETIRESIPNNIIHFDEDGREYVEIELFNDSTSVTQYNTWKPKPKISEIILGANFNNQEIIEEIKGLMPNIIIRKSKTEHT